MLAVLDRSYRFQLCPVLLFVALHSTISLHRVGLENGLDAIFKRSKLILNNISYLNNEIEEEFISFEGYNLYGSD